MASVVTYSDSVVGSLCREVDGIRHRSSYLLNAMERCQNACLTCRLHREFVQLQQRRLEVLNAARHWQQRSAAHSLGLAFLIELCGRPVSP